MAMYRNELEEAAWWLTRVEAWSDLGRWRNHYKNNFDRIREIEEAVYLVRKRLVESGAK